MHKLKNMFSAILNNINTIPQPVRVAAKKAFLLFIVWKLVYLFLLLPTRVLDKPLTDAVGGQTTHFLNAVYGTEDFVSKPTYSHTIIEGQLQVTQASLVFFKDKSILFVADPCNGLELIILYIGFILVMPARFKRKFGYMFFGVLLIYLLNVLRCAGLVMIHIYLKHYFVFAHHYLFKIIIYATIFILWTFFSKNLDFKKS